MTAQYYIDGFAKLGLIDPPVDTRYDPDNFGRSLLVNCPRKKGVAYSTNTKLTKKTIKAREKK